MLSSSSLKPLLAAACVATLVAASGCGEEQSRGGTVPGDTLTVFSSLPLQGPRAEQSKSIVNAQKLALRDSGGRVGDYKVNFASADDATAGGPQAIPGGRWLRPQASMRGSPTSIKPRSQTSSRSSHNRAPRRRDSPFRTRLPV